MSEGSSLSEAVALASRHLEQNWDSANQVRRVVRILDRFASFAAAAFEVRVAAAVTAEVAAAFFHAGVDDGGAPSVPLMHLRRSALRLLFRALRDAGGGGG